VATQWKMFNFGAIHAEYNSQNLYSRIKNLRFNVQNVEMTSSKLLKMMRIIQEISNLIAKTSNKINNNHKLSNITKLDIEWWNHTSNNKDKIKVKTSKFSKITKDQAFNK